MGRYRRSHAEGIRSSDTGLEAIPSRPAVHRLLPLRTGKEAVSIGATKTLLPVLPPRIFPKKAILCLFLRNPKNMPSDLR